MVEAINGGVAIQTPEYKIKSDDGIAPDKVARIEDQKVRPDQEIIEKEKIQVSQVLDALNDNINTIHNVGLEFSKHEDSGREVIKVVEKETGDLIRQIPPEEMLDLAVRMNELVGILFDERV